MNIIVFLVLWAALIIGFAATWAFIANRMKTPRKP